jgi:hypothetical protein
MDYVRREVEERKLVEEAIDPDSIEGFGHVEMTRFQKCLGIYIGKGLAEK